MRPMPALFDAFSCHSNQAALNQPTSVRFVRPRLWRRSLPRRCAPTLRLAASRRTEGAYRSAASPTRAVSRSLVVLGLGYCLRTTWGWEAIQAGLIVTELMWNGGAVLILTPAGLREQWATEQSRRFAISASLVDFHDVRHRLATLPIGSNPWSTVPVAIASIDYVKRPEILSRCSCYAGTFSQ